MSRRLQTEKIERVVVRGANWVGDAVLTVPALRELRRALPNAHITLATRAWAKGIFEDADFVDEILVIKDAGSGPGAVWSESREWRERCFDLALLFPNAFAPALVAALAGVPSRIGYAAQGRSLLLTNAIALPDWRGQRHEVFYYLNIVKELERTLHGPKSERMNEPMLELNVSEQRKQAARALLNAQGIRAARPLVAICPGSTNSRAKRWPVERFAALADMLVERAGVDVALIGAREELDVSEEVVRLMHQSPFILTGKTDLATTAAVLSIADLLVTNDTGPAHIAAAIGCPVIVIFGPTNPLTTRPFSTLAEVVRRPPDCAPCMLRDCPIDHRCMTAISIEEVFTKAAHSLESRRKMEVAL